MKTQTQTYTSPHTGKTYTVVPVENWRQSWDENGVPYKKYYTEYNFYEGPVKVTWTYDLDEKHLADTFGEIEGVFRPWSTSARD